jgi:hypothetical protein
LTKKNHQETYFASGQDRKSKSAINNKGLPTIRCVCGMRILVVPDLRAMDRAIKNHIAEHKQSNYGLVFDSLDEFLTEQVLMLASEINLPNVS